MRITTSLLIFVLIFQPVATLGNTWSADLVSQAIESTMGDAHCADDTIHFVDVSELPDPAGLPIQFEHTSEDPACQSDCEQCTSCSGIFVLGSLSPPNQDWFSYSPNECSVPLANSVSEQLYRPPINS